MQLVQLLVRPISLFPSMLVISYLPLCCFVSRLLWSMEVYFNNCPMTRYNVAMAIVIHLDRLMAEKKVSLNELSERVGISVSNLSKMKTGKIRAVRFSTLEAICTELDCQPGDLIECTTKRDVH